DFPFAKNPLSVVYLAFTSIAYIAAAFAMYSVFRSFWNYEYQKLAGPTALKRHFDDLIAWHSANSQDLEEATKRALDDFRDYIDARLSEAAEWNGQNNVARGNYLHRATAAVAIAVACFIPAAVLYAHTKASAGEKVHQVRIVAPFQTEKEY